MKSRVLLLTGRVRYSWAPAQRPWLCRWGAGGGAVTAGPLSRLEPVLTEGPAGQLKTLKSLH